MPLLTPDYVFRKWEVDGVPDSGPHKPKKDEIIQLLIQIYGGTAAIGDFRGAWDSATAYVDRDFVQKGGNIWYALRNNTGVTPVEGADWTLLLPGATVADGTITNVKVASNAAIDPAKLSFLRSGTGMVARNVYHYLADRARSPFDANPGLGAVNDTSVNARADNKASYLLVAAQRETIELPLGTIYMPDDALLPFNPGNRIIGQGHHGINSLGKETGSGIRGDGNIFSTNVLGTGRSMRDFFLGNETTGQEGVLVSVDMSAAPNALTDVQFEGMYFGKATRHINASGGCAVGWYLCNNIYEGATVVSRLFGFTTRLMDIHGYSKNNNRCLQLDDGGYHEHAEISGVMEGTTLNAILIRGNDTEGVRDISINVWFENNGAVGGSADILFSSANSPFQGIDLQNSIFSNTQVGSAQTLRIDFDLTGTASFGRIYCGPGFTQRGGVPLTANIANRVYLQNPNGLQVVQALYQKATYAP